MTDSVLKMSARATLLALVGVLAAQTASAQNYTIKFGVGRIDPRATSGDLTGTLPIGGGATTAVPAGNQLEVQPKSTVLFSIERRLDDNWGLELALGIPPTHDVKLHVSDQVMAGAATATAVFTAAGGSAAGTVVPYLMANGTPVYANAVAQYTQLAVAAHVSQYNNAVVSHVKQTAPTIFLNYKFFEPSSAFRPYVGVGFNYTQFKATATQAGTDLYNDGPVKISLTNSIGFAFQTGVTYKVDKSWSVNAGWATAAVKNNMTIETNTAKQEATYRFHPSMFSVTAGYSF